MTAPDPSGPSPSADGPPGAGGAPARHVVLYIDGASSGNPGPCGCAAVLKDAQGETLLERARAFGPGTNNEAEYQALLLGLEAAAQLQATHLVIRSDSELLVRQVAGQYRIKAPHLKPLYRQAMRALGPFKGVEIQHIPRTKNTEADALARKAVERAREVDARIPQEARKKPQPKTFRLK